MKGNRDGLTALHDGEPIYSGLYANYGVADKPSCPHAEPRWCSRIRRRARRGSMSTAAPPATLSAFPETRDESDAMPAYLYQHAEPHRLVPLPLDREYDGLLG
jgi:taurine dioxygenase